jgi:hypothetical protein
VLGLCDQRDAGCLFDGAPPAPEAMAPAPGPGAEDLFPPCQGVLVVYETTFTKKIYPYLNDTPWIQPYRFQATATLLNEGYSSIENWEMGILYQHGEVRIRIPETILHRLDGCMSLSSEY